MADSVWTVGELSAAVEAYLQMLRLERDGTPYNKSAIRRALISGPIAGRSTTEQRMQNISHVMQTMGRSWISGYKPLPNVGLKTENILRQIISDMIGPNAVPMPVRPPREASGPNRKLPPTGYWMFVCNRTTWDGEAWLQSGETQLLYKVSKHNAPEIQAGDLGVLRLNSVPGSNRRAMKPAALYALFEVMGSAGLQSDPDPRAYADPADAAKIVWRAPVRVVANLSANPVIVTELPDDPDFQYLRSPLMTSTIPLSRRAYSAAFQAARVDAIGLAIERSVQDLTNIRRIEKEGGQDPKQKSRISKYIERGPVGAAVKAARGGRCQICEALKVEPIAFWKKGGAPYSEAHHVFPVSLLKSGSLGAANIMVLCPNHHREAHYGSFDVVENGEASWKIRHRDTIIEIEKTKID